MNPSLTDTLCTHCALCCDGSLFADVELAGQREATGLEVMGLAIDDDADRPLLLLPCVALQGKRCGVYAHRPGCCRTFECQLLQDVRHGDVGVAQAKAHIADALKRIGRVKELMARLGQREERLSLKERCAEALAGIQGASPEANQARGELEAAMSAVETLISSRFLGDGRKRGTAHR